MNKIKFGAMGIGFVALMVFSRLTTCMAERNAAAMTANAEQEAARARIGAGPQNETENEKLGRKLSAYSEPCINQLGDDVRRVGDQYFRWAHTAPLTAENTRPGSIGRINARQCEQAMQNAARLEPPMPDVEITGRVYLTAVKALDAVLARAAEYYGEQNYNDDHFTMANTLHTELKTQVANVRVAEIAFRGALDVHHDRMVERRLTELERAPGRKLQFLVTRVSHDALRLMRMAEQGEIDDAGKLTGIDSAELQRQAAAFEATVDTLRAHYQAHPEERQTVENVSGYINAVNGVFVPEVKAMARRFRDSAGAFTEEELHSNPIGDGNVAGSPGRMLRQYNSTVSAYNRLRFEVLTTNATH